jgi:DNA repair protein RadA/Sms
VHRCSDCGAEFPKWGGRCEACGAWNTLVEEPLRTRQEKRAGPRRAAPRSGVAPATPIRLAAVDMVRTTGTSSGTPELDRVLGGQIVPGSVVLVGGEPGIGKSTLLLQVAADVVRLGGRALYVSGEESALQVRMRAERVGRWAMEVELLSETLLSSILATAREHAPTLIVVDSIQTLYAEELEGSPGSVGQVRECAAQLMRLAKETGSAVFLVGHVTKVGGIAGPKTLEHVVDTVLYFEGDGSLDHRVLRATKNRFGSVDEIGVFRMTPAGLEPVENPSALFMGDRRQSASGSAVTALMEGTRPMLVEVQALAARCGFGTPQRVATGFDGRRLALLLAVLERRAGIRCSELDVFLNVAGGLRLLEPAGELAIVAALASSVHDRPLPNDALFVGEVGLGGEVRAVTRADRRLAEAAQLGFTTAYVSDRAPPERRAAAIRVVPVPAIRELFAVLFP